MLENTMMFPLRFSYTKGKIQFVVCFKDRMRILDAVLVRRATSVSLFAPDALCFHTPVCGATSIAHCSKLPFTLDFGTFFNELAGNNLEDLVHACVWGNSVSNERASVGEDGEEATLIIPRTNLMTAIHPNPVVVSKMLGCVSYTPLEWNFAFRWVGIDKVL